MIEILKLKLVEFGEIPAFFLMKYWNFVVVPPQYHFGNSYRMDITSQRMDRMITANSTVTSQGPNVMDEFMRKASTYPQFKIGVAVHDYYFLFIVIIGVIGDTLNFLVMVMPHNRDISTCVYMACLSVSDTMLLVYQGYSVWMLPAFELHPVVSMHCLWNKYTGFGLSMTGSLIIVAMTFGKFFAIRFPHKSASFNTPTRAKVVVIVIVLFSFVFNLPHFYVTMLIDETCMPYARQGVWTQIFMFVSFVFNAAGIFGALIIMNGFIISAVLDRKKLLRNMGNDNNSSTSEAKHQRSMERQITIMLLLVSFLYLILIGPGFIHFLSWLIVPPNRNPETYANFVLSYNVCQKFFFTNNSINFFLYCISGRKFCADLFLLFCCNTHTGKNGSDSCDSGNKEQTQFTDVSDQK